MMSLIDLDDDQRWVPTHVNVTVLRARGLRTKGKHGSRYLYTIIQVGKEKYTTGLVEKANIPEWNEECCFELLPGILEECGRSAHPPGSGHLVLTVMHRVLIGLDVFLGQTIIPLDKIFQDGMCPRDEWFKLNSKVGRKEKDRGELQVTVQFTRNNMTASMFDLTMKDKPRSAFGKLKDRVTGRKRGDMESSSAIVPGRYAALSGSLGQPFGEDGRGTLEPSDVEIAEEKRSKMKDFFKGRLSKSSDTRSCSSLASDSSLFSIASDSPPPSLDLLSDPPSSPIYTSKVRVDTHYGETDLAKKVLTSQHTTRVLTHKRAFSDEASKITTAFPRPNTAVESLKGQTMTQSKSSLCINGSHVYDSEPSTPKSSAAHPSKLVLLEKCSPLSRSLQNLTKRSEDKGPFADSRRWSFDKTKKEEKDVEKEGQTFSDPIQEAEIEGHPEQAVTPDVSSTGNTSDKGKKLRKSLFSGGRSDSLPAKSDVNQGPSTSEGRFRGWFGSGDSQNKPRLEVSPKVESNSDVPPTLPPCSPVPPKCSSPPVSPSSHVSVDDCSPTNPFTTSNSSSSISHCNLFPSQHNPFFEELIAEESQRFPPFAPCSPSASSTFHDTCLPPKPCTLSPVGDVNATNTPYKKRERPRPVPRQISLPTILPKTATPNINNKSSRHSESVGEWDDSFDAFASSRLSSPKGSHPQSHCDAQEQVTHEDEPPPLPPRRLLRTSVNEIYSDGWLHRGQELAVHKEAYLLSQTGVASLQHGREAECKRNSTSPDPHTSSEASDTITVNSQPCTIVTSQGVLPGEKLKKFKYEPLEDGTDFWGGMLFEQDLYGRVCQGNYRQPKVNNHFLSLNAEEMSRNKIPSMNLECKQVGNSEMSPTDLLNLLPITPPKPDAKVLDITDTQIEEMKSNPSETTRINNNVSFSLTLGDLNMNVNQSDFNFIDSDGSSQSDVIDSLKGVNSSGGAFPKLLDGSLIAAYNADIVTTPQDVFTLKDTYIREMNSSFEITALSNKWCKVPPICQNIGQPFQCKLNNMTPHGNSRIKSKYMSNLSSQNQRSNPADLGSTADISSVVSKRAQRDFDDNGNPEGEIVTPNQKDSFSGVVSARLRPKSLSRQSSSGSSNNQSRSGDREFEQLLSLVQNISGDSEGPFSYQPTKSALSTLLAFSKQTDLQGDGINKDQTYPDKSNLTSQVSSTVNTSILSETSVAVESPKSSFEDLHAKVAPISKTPLKTLQELESASLYIPCTVSSSSDAQSTLLPNPFCYPSIHSTSMEPSTGISATLAVAPNTSSYSTTTDQLLVDARQSLLPEETHPASNLPHQESRSQPVKPLTSSQSEKKESRSVLEKLKSTIHPGRTTHQVAGEPERSQEVTVERLAQYQHLTNMELISLLLQQEMDMQKQQALSEQQEAQLQKCESELKKVKLQVRDLEDYIDNLLLRIMEQTPTLLQVRTRHK
ncbi:rab11 family-interacting protein 1 [Antennarius striatus]|uniref:rab11 family-interacting protein 1 n=1 Tax=Antennarius striatus TaxID=241820 RepID=UPI0035B11E95